MRTKDALMDQEALASRKAVKATLLNLSVAVDGM